MQRRFFMAAGLSAALCGGGAYGRSNSAALVYVGTQGSDILAVRFDRSNGALSLLGPVAAVERPTWLAVDPDRSILHAVSELGNDGQPIGTVHSFAIDRTSGALRSIGRVPSGGGGPTHISYDGKSQSLFVANFGTGTVAVMPVRENGGLAEAASIISDSIAQKRTGQERAGEEDGAHAHAALLDPQGRFLLTPDKGTDRIYVRRFDAARRTLSPGDPPFIDLPRGSGPRHLTFLRDGRFVYLVTEVTAEVRAFSWEGRSGRLAPLQTLAIDPPEFVGTHSAAEIALSPDGRFLYASSRAGHALAVYSVNKGSGLLTRMQYAPSQGKWPRSFAIDPSGRWMLVANQESQTIVVFKIDPRTGKLAATGTPLEVPQKPVAFAFVP